MPGCRGKAARFLTQRGKPEGKKYRLMIPNREIREIFKDQILELFKAEVERDGDTLRMFCEALQSGNAAEVERLFAEYLCRTVSNRDTFVRKPTKENFPMGKATTKASKVRKPSVCFYHGLLLGILGFKNRWFVKSNRETGDGYCDILVKVEDADIGIIIEVKYAENGRFDAVCKGAMEQIEADGYTAELVRDGCHRIYKYGIACYKKSCRVMLETESNGPEEWRQDSKTE